MTAERIPVVGEGIVVHRFGIPGARPKVYLQGALHADEVSATMALANLVGLLETADAAGQVCGEIIVVPHCNPLGAKQFALGRHLGRFSLDGRNFNRAFPQVGDRVVERLKGLGPVRQTIKEALRIGAEILGSLARVGTPIERLQAGLMELAWGSDIIVDVHADMEALLHLYTSEISWPVFRPLVQRFGIPVVILANKSADCPFDEVHGEAWDIINAHLGEGASQSGFRTAACTLELRGLSDVTPEFAAADSRALCDFLLQSGASTGAGQAATDATAFVTTLDAVEVARSAITGVVIPLKPLGATVDVGDVVARLYDPFEPDPRQCWQDVVTETGGIIFARWHQRVIQAGMAVVKIAGSEGTRSAERALLLD